jgi:CBS domain containing-hemolysin-like protein
MPQRPVYKDSVREEEEKEEEPEVDNDTFAIHHRIDLDEAYNRYSIAFRKHLDNAGVGTIGDLANADRAQELYAKIEDEVFRYINNM